MKQKSILFFIPILLIILITLTGCSSSTISNNTNNTNTTSSIPTDIELMSYAQTVLDDNLNNPSYSSNTSDYKFVNTLLRYKIEGSVTENSVTDKFYMIIEFVDDTYKEYDLISLQVGNDIIYKK